MDDSFQSYARARLLRSRPDADHRDVDAYVRSPAFAALAVTLDKNLMNALDRFLASERNDTAMTPPATPEPADPAVPPAEAAAEAANTVRPYAMPELSAAEPAQAAQQAEPLADPAQEPDPATDAVPDAVPDVAPDTLPATAHGPAPVAAAPPSAFPDIVLRLPNARAGSLYSGRIEATTAASDLVFEEVIVPEELALTAHLASGTLGGTPAAAGDYALTVVYRLAGEEPPRQRRTQLQLTVTPDPRTMWKNLPSDSKDPYWRDDSASSLVEGPDMRIVAASKRGRSHAHVGSFRDDDYFVGHVGTGDWYLAILADGAGSAKFSRRGAEIICHESHKQVCNTLNGPGADRIDAAVEAYARAEGAARDALHATLHESLSRVVGNAAYYSVRAIMQETAERTDLGGTFKDYASTALIGICKRYPFGTLCAAYWVGDGAIGVYSKRDGITLLGDADSGEFSGQTRFLDTAAIEHGMLLKRTRFALVEDMTAFVLMTDGVSDAKFETEARLHRDADWHAFWKELESAVDFTDRDFDPTGQLLEWLDFWSQGNHDDRTIAIVL